MEMSVLIEKMIIFLVLMVIGYALAKRGTLNAAFTKAASALLVNVFTSASILNSGMAMEVSMEPATLGKVMLVICAMQALGYVLAAVVARLTPGDRDHAPEYELLMSMGNSLFIALPIVNDLYGPVAVLYVGLSCIPFNLLLYTYGVWRLKSGQGGDRMRVKDIFTIPLGATLVSLLIVLLQPPIPGAIRGLVSATAGATMPFSMIVIGASLGSVSLLDAFKNGRLYIVSFIRLIVAPLLTWLVLRGMTSDPVLLMTMIIVAASPSAVMVTVLGVQYGRDAVYTSEGTLQNTVLSMVTIPLIVWLLG